MFKLIGMVVFVSVVVIGYPSLQRWYSGEASPEQTLNEMRNSVGQKLIIEEQGKAPPSAEKQNAVPPPSNETDAEKALRKLLEKK
jgi:hypothetical protein